MTAATSKGLRYIVPFKSPLAWLVSDSKYHKEKLTAKIGMAKIQEWTDYIAKWIELRSLAPDRIALVPYEALLRNVEHVLTRVDRVYGNELFSKATATITRPHRVPQSHSSWEDCQSKYLNCSYIRAIPVSVRHTLIAHVSQIMKGKLHLAFDDNGCVTEFDVVDPL